MFMFYLAEKLHKTIAEIGSISAIEFLHWQMYYGLKAQKQQLADRVNHGHR